MTIDDDVAMLLESIRKQRNASLKDVVNCALRGGLAAMVRPPEPRPVFRTRAFPTGKCLIPNLESVADAMAIAEGEDYR